MTITVRQLCRIFLSSLLASAAAFALTAASGWAAIDRAGAAAREGGEAAVAQEAARRSPFPPSKLWYRISIEFKGEAHARQRGPDGSVATNELSASWKLRSNTAVLVTLLCRGRLPGDEPFVVKRKIGGRQVPVGGCPQDSGSSYSSTLRFAANATGRLTRWTNDTSVTPGGSCPGGSETTNELVSSQPVVGSISTPSSVGDGLLVSVDGAQPLGTVHQHAECRDVPFVDCSKDDDPLTTGPSDCPEAGRRTSTNDIDYDFQPVSVWGDDVVIASRGGWRPLRDFLRFHLTSASRFGKAFEWTLKATQTAKALPYPPAPAPAAFGPHYTKHYNYTLRFDPCPRGGRDVKSC